MKLELPLVNEIKSIIPIPNITIPSREQLKSVVTPYGEFPYHNIDHMIAVAKKQLDTIITL